MKKFLPFSNTLGVNKTKGFTLVELLVTISIISILSVIGMVAYSTVLKQGRDSKRQSDLRSIQSALEQYYADQFSYPDNLSFGSSLVFGAKTYMNRIPTDPTGEPLGYGYGYVLQSFGYCLYAKLENSNPGTPLPCGPNGSYNFVVSPP